MLESERPAVRSCWSVDIWWSVAEVRDQVLNEARPGWEWIVFLIQQAVIMGLVIIGKAATKVMDGYADSFNRIKKSRGEACAACATALHMVTLRPTLTSCGTRCKRHCRSCWSNFPLYAMILTIRGRVIWVFKKGVKLIVSNLYLTATEIPPFEVVWHCFWLWQEL